MTAESPSSAAARAVAFVHLVHGLSLARGHGGGLGLAVVVASAVALGAPRRPHGWGLLFALDALGIGLFPLDAANHHWLLAYVSLLFCAGRLGAGPVEDARGVRGLLAVVMLFATVQKALSPDFVSGRFFAFLLTTSELAEPAVRGLPVLDRGLLANLKAWQAVLPLGDPSIAIQLRWPPGHLAALTSALVWSTLAAEAALFALALRPRRDAWLPAALGLFTLPLILLRPEHTFAALLCACAAVLTSPDARRLRGWLLVQTALLCALALLEVGRP